jgi:multiple sugar transport system substrate-binding protein
MRMNMMQRSEGERSMEKRGARSGWMRRFSPLVAVMIIVALLAACSNNAGSKDEKKTIRFVVLEYSDQTLKTFQQIADDFTKENPNIEVKLENLDWGSAYEKFVAWNSSGQVPDGAMIGPKWIPEFRELGVIEAFDDYVDPTFLNNFSKSLIDPLTIDDKLWALPMALSTRLMYYRTDLLKEANLGVPKTWDEFLNATQTLHKDDQYGFVVQASDDETIWYYNYFLFGAGGSFLGPDGKFKVDGPANVEALQFEVDLINKHKVTQPQPTAAGRDTVEQAFAEGKAAFYWGAPWTFARVERDNPELAKNVAVADYPTKSGTPAPMYIQDSFALFEGSKNKQETVDFMEFWMQDKYHVPFSISEGTLPVTISAGEDTFWADSPIYSEFIKSLPASRTYPIAASWEAVNIEVRQAVQAAILGTPAQDALTAAQKRIEAITSR